MDVTMAKKSRHYIALRAHTDGTLRTAKLHGEDYTVVPVVALQEGVIQGITATNPEFVSADVFGKFPYAWNGRPLTIDHPNDGAGPVGANNPQVLENYQIGWLFNAKVDGKQLKIEAWIHNGRARKINDANALLEKLEAGDVIEVSTGYFAAVDDVTGRYNGTPYKGTHTEIVPDHLAFLPHGKVGACSNADGCGASVVHNAAATGQQLLIHVPMTSSSQTVGDCGCGGSESSCSCVHGHTSTGELSGHQSFEEVARVLQGIFNRAPGWMVDSDKRTLIQRALYDERAARKTTGEYVGGCYVSAIAEDWFVYSEYNYSGDAPYERNYRRSYSIDENTRVTLGTDVEEVNILMDVQPVAQESATARSTPMANEDTKTTTPGKAGTPQGAGTTTTSTQPAPPASSVVTPPPATAPVTPDPTGVVQPPVPAQPNELDRTTRTLERAPQTLDQFINSAPPEMQEVMRQSLALHQARKTELVDSILATNRSKFTKEQLSAFSIDMLEGLASLAAVPTYEGRHHSTSPPSEVKTHEGDSAWGVPKPPGLLVQQTPVSGKPN
jgi:hypothetical protein